MVYLYLIHCGKFSRVRFGKLHQLLRQKYHMFDIVLIISHILVNQR